MNFLPLEAALASGSSVVQIGPASVGVPTLREDVSARALLCGVRPEHVRFADGSALRAEVLGTEYIGSGRIVTLSVGEGTTVRAKVDVSSTAKRGDRVGLAFDAAAVSLFDRTTGRALRTARDDRSHAAAGRDARPVGIAAHHG
jgi:multiple sugar transport system ATP-binding protein